MHRLLRDIWQDKNSSSSYMKTCAPSRSRSVFLARRMRPTRPTNQSWCTPHAAAHQWPHTPLTADVFFSRRTERSMLAGESRYLIHAHVATCCHKEKEISMNIPRWLENKNVLQLPDTKILFFTIKSSKLHPVNLPISCTKICRCKTSLPCKHHTFFLSRFINIINAEDGCHISIICHSELTFS